MEVGNGVGGEDPRHDTVVAKATVKIVEEIHNLMSISNIVPFGSTIGEVFFSGVKRDFHGFLIKKKCRHVQRIYG